MLKSRFLTLCFGLNDYLQCIVDMSKCTEKCFSFALDKIVLKEGLKYKRCFFLSGYNVSDACFKLMQTKRLIYILHVSLDLNVVCCVGRVEIQIEI